MTYYGPQQLADAAERAGYVKKTARLYRLEQYRRPSARNDRLQIIPARAAYAAIAPAALPAEGTAAFLTPSSFAIEMAAVIPRALKLCVGFCPSSLM